MAQTLSTDLWAPEVWVSMIQAEFSKAVRVYGSSAVVVDTTLTTQPGQTIVFPKWTQLQGLVKPAETDTLVPMSIGQTKTTATVVEVAGAARYTERADLVNFAGKGATREEIVRQFGQLLARQIDRDLLAAAIAQQTVTTASTGATSTADALSYTIPDAAYATGLTAKHVISACMEFADSFDPRDFAGLFVNTATLGLLRNDPDFISAQNTAQGNTMILGGQIGSINGLPVIQTDQLDSLNVAATTSPAARAQRKALMLKKESLGLKIKKAPEINEDQNILARATDVVMNTYYGCARLKDNGVCQIKVPY